MNTRLLRLSACVLAIGLARCKGPSPASDPVSPHAADTTFERDTGPTQAHDTGATQALDTATPQDDGARTDATLAEPKPSADTEPAPPEVAAPAPAVAPRPTSDLPRLSPGSLPLEARLVAEVGQGLPVAILPTPVGLVAMSSDGARSVLLVEGDVPWALVDNAAGVVWFALPSATVADADATIDLVVLDLRGSTLDLVVVARRLVDGSQVEVDYLDPATSGPSVPWPTVRYGARVDVMVGNGKPRLEASGGIYSDLGIVDGEANANAVKLAQPDATTQVFLDGLRARALAPKNDPSTRARQPKSPRPPKRLKVPPACENASVCGLVSRFGNSPYWAVIVSHSCGDACHTSRQLYDPKAKVFLSLLDPDVTSPEPLTDDANDVLGAIVSLDGSAFVKNGRVYRFGHAPVEPRLPDGVISLTDGGGWLGGQTNQE